MAENKKIRILLVNDNDVLRSGLAIFLDTFADLQLVDHGTTEKKLSNSVLKCNQTSG